MKQEEIQNEYQKTYDKGLLNHGVRAWFYLQRGLNLVNEFKYLVAGIFALYYTLQLEDYRLMVVLFVVAIPLLTFVGWFHTFKMAKALEWTSMMFSSYFARYNVDLAEKNTEHTVQQAETLREIRDLLIKIRDENRAHD